MIRYTLRCADGHTFESWFASGAEYDRLSAAALLSCPVCGVPRIAKDVMAPQVQTSGDSARSAPAAPDRPSLADLRRRIEATSEQVGRGFPAEARRIHAGEAPARPIIGEARPAEARALIEEGVPILPLPWSNRKLN